jgi:hypothetical protein
LCFVGDDVDRVDGCERRRSMRVRFPGARNDERGADPREGGEGISPDRPHVRARMVL